MKKLIFLGGIIFTFFLISCEPVKIVSAKYNGTDVIPLPCGYMKMIAFTINNRHYNLLFNYVFSDTIIFRPSTHTIRRGIVISLYPYVPNSKNHGTTDYILYGDSIMLFTGFQSSRMDVAVSDTFFVHISGFFDKKNNPILIKPIEYYIEDEVKYIPFRDKGRDYISSKKKIDRKNGYLIFDDGSYRTYR